MLMQCLNRALQLIEEDTTLTVSPNNILEEDILENIVLAESHSAIAPPTLPLTTGDLLFGPLSNPLPSHLEAKASTTKPPPPRFESSVPGSSNGQPSTVWERYDPIAWETTHTITRRQLNTSSPTKECIICVDTKDITHFPHQAITDLCDHAPSTCQDCIATYIRSELNGKLFHEQVIKCPECSQPLSRDDIQQHADPDTFSR
jgi:hypothetical protein